MCSYAGCPRAVRARGLCITHYERVRRTGRIETLTTLDRFMAKVDKTDADGCWIWRGTVCSGYGCVTVNKIKIGAHRLSYELFVGPIPDGLHIDHLCRIPTCVNPAHLEAVTQLENNRRQRRGTYWADKTHCPQGHPYDAANTYLNTNGGRQCRSCKRRIDRASNDKRVA